MKRAIFFVLLLTLGPASFSQNLVVNPGFESWGKTNKPTGWNTAQNCLKDSVFFKSGYYSCRHEADTSTTNPTRYLGQTISVSPGNLYTLSFFFKTEITGNGNGCRIWCLWQDAEFKSISDASTKPILQPSKYMKSDTWQQFSTDIIAPANASYFYLEVRVYQNSIAYWDDFVFEKSALTAEPDRAKSLPEIYPNPTSNYLIISNIQNIQYIDIQSFTGIKKWSSLFSGEQEVTVPVSGLADGLYLIRIRTSDELIVRKFIKKAF
jgi:hypothetical protein